MAIIIGYLTFFRVEGSRRKGREDAPGMLKRTVLASWEMRHQDWASMSAPG